MTIHNEQPTPPSNRATPASLGEILNQEEQARVLSSFRLTLKLVAMVFLVVLVLGTISFVLVERIFATITPAIRRDLEWKALHGVIELSNTAALGVIAHDRDAVAGAAADLLSDADVVAIHVTGEQGVVFDHGAATFDWPSFEMQHGKVFDHGGALIAVAPVEIEGLVVGRVHLAVSERRLLAGKQLRSTLLLTAGIGGLIALGLALGFVQLYIAPLLRVAAEAFRKLEKATVEAIEAARLKSEFLANMSHEIRTPMNGIMGVTKLALATQMEPKQRRYLELIDTSARGLLTVINDILDFSKIEAGKYELHVRPFDVRAVVQESLEMIADRAEQKGLRVTQRVATDVPAWLEADPDRIKQVLINLVGNAVKFTERGEVVITVSAEPDEKALSRLRVSVKDTGTGISHDAQARLFHAFTQVDGSYARQHGGTGLGLAIAKRLTELMGGEIGVVSAPGEGSEFWFTVSASIAAIDQDALQDASRAAGSIHPHADRRRLRTDRPVLVVDDNEINRFVAVEHLRQMGFAADTVVNGAEAIAAVRHKAYLAVLMDCQMPVMDGYAAAREIRNWEAGQSHIPIIAVTAHALVGERDHVIAAGMDDYVPKPVKASELERVLLHWTRRGLDSLRPATANTPSVAPQADDRSGELDDDAEVTPRLAELFLRLAPEQLEELDAALMAHDESVARALAHKLKGGLFAVGATRLARAVEDLRNEVAAGKWANADAQMVAIRQRFDAVLNAVRTQAACIAAEPSVEEVS